MKNNEKNVDNINNKYNICIEGMHCDSCAVFINNKIKNIDGVKSVKTDLRANTVMIESDKTHKVDDLVNIINQKLEDTEYKASESVGVTHKAFNLMNYVGPFFVALVLFLLLYGLQLTGISNAVNISELTPFSIFIIGLVASLSSCMFVVGSIVLSISSILVDQFGKKAGVSIIAFHISRVLGFLLFGGLIGYLGSFFNINNSAHEVIDLVVVSLTFFIGLGMIDSRLRFSFGLHKHIWEGANKVNVKYAYMLPIIVGAATFFLPCGFTQSMQLQAVKSASFLEGAKIMFIFALGTLPALGLVSFFSLKSFKINSDFFHKTVGFIIVIFAIYSIFGHSA